MSDYVQSARLRMRQFTADDADLLVELDSDPAVMRYLSGGEPMYSPEVMRDEVIPSVLGGYERWDGRFGLFAAHEKEGGAFIGWFHLRPEREGPLDEVELGYRLRQAAWGKGYATEGAQALVDKAFTELDVSTVWGATMALNVASQNVMKKVGMSVVEPLPTPEDMQGAEGAELGGFRFEITRERWEGR